MYETPRSSAVNNPAVAVASRGHTETHRYLARVACVGAILDADSSADNLRQWPVCFILAVVSAVKIIKRLAADAVLLLQ